MKFHKVWEKYKNCIIAFLTILVNLVVICICFDFYYALNDDVLMKDIMAGVYTGTPNGHNMQTLYILGAFIGLCYRLCRGLPWYGLFLFLCQFGSLYLVGARMLRLCRKGLEKAGCLLVLSALIWGVILGHLIFIQYTVTCTMLAAAAIFLFVTTGKRLTVKEFVIQNIPSVLLVILAYQLRTEMLLLVFPFIGLAGLFCWMEEEKSLLKENFYKYGIIISCILAGMLFSRLIDLAAYGSEEWKEFVSFFQYRTEVYDFHYDILTSGEHQDSLAAIGITDAKQELLANYNFGLDEEIDAEMLEKIAAYAVSADSTLLSEKFLKQGRFYIYRTLHTADAPYNLLVIAGYLCVFLFSIWSAVEDRRRPKRWSFLWELGLLGIVRTFLWMYILMRGRDPERITHSLYLAEFAVLMGMLAMRFIRTEQPQLSDSLEKQSKIWRTGMLAACVLIGGICLCNLPGSIRTAIADREARAEANQGGLAIAEYCKAHPDNFYFEDVYSTVKFSQKIFENVDNSMTNYDIMGGWMCKSPLYREKLEQYGIQTMENGLLHDPHVYFIMETGTPDSGTEWMRAYYAEKGMAVRIEQVDLIADKYAVYQVKE